MNSKELTLLPQLFLNYSSVTYWRVDFFVQNEANPNQTLSGMASLMLKKNELPSNGLCFVDKTNGTSLQTWFQIICNNWIDPDGQIVSYEFMG